MMNYKQASLSLAQFKGKYVLLNFWASWCGACLSKLDLLDSMQRKYPDKLQILLVSSTKSGDTEEKLKKFFNTRMNSSKNRFILPTAYKDSIARKYFPGAGVPHYAWIDRNMNCIAITSSEELTANNIEMLVNDRLPKFNGMALTQSYKQEKPLFSEGNAGNGEGIMFRSTLSKFIPGMTGSFRYLKDKNGLTSKYTFINIPLLQIIKIVYSTLVRDDRIVFNVSDSIKRLLLPKSDSEKMASSFT
jgi:thiol-disulfide isomerase/thioredoxin